MLFGIGCLFHVYGRQSGIYHKRQVITTLSKTYSNEYFSIDYPTGYEVEASFPTKPVGIEELKDMTPEAIQSLLPNELYINPDISNQYWEKPEIYIVLSRHKLDFPLRLMMGLSIETKEKEQNGGMEYIGCTEVDSINFAGYPAFTVDFAYRASICDTLIQHQIIVQKPNYELYYINAKYNLRNSRAEKLGEEIISIFKFK